MWFVLAMVETADARSHRGDPPVFCGRAGNSCWRSKAGAVAIGSQLCRSVRSVDVEHGLAADAALEEGVERSGRFAP